MKRFETGPPQHKSDAQEQAIVSAEQTGVIEQIDVMEGSQIA